MEWIPVVVFNESSREEDIMTCSRCNKKMIYEKFYTEEGSYWAWHCIYCGEVVDPLIYKNRSLSEQKEMEK